MDNLKNILLAFAIPVFILSMIIEYFLYRRRGQAGYLLKDTCASLSMGIGNVILGSIFFTMIFSIYKTVYHFHVFTIPQTWLTYCLLFLLEDYTYYWYHRTSHVSYFFWTAHETHHSSECYNFSTALRQTWTGILTSWVFWTPLLLLGFSPTWVMLQQTISLLYQFFIHTELVKKVGVLEWVFNTPSHHRVHHGKDIHYLDCNYAGILIIWDRLHGTFIPESSQAHYGTLTPVNSFNPFYIGFHMWIKIVYAIKSAPTLLTKLKILFYPPGWHWQDSQTSIELKKKLVTDPSL